MRSIPQIASRQQYVRALIPNSIPPEHHKLLFIQQSCPMLLRYRCEDKVRHRRSEAAIDERKPRKACLPGLWLLSTDVCFVALFEGFEHGVPKVICAINSEAEPDRHSGNERWKQVRGGCVFSSNNLARLLMRGFDRKCHSGRPGSWRDCSPA